MNCALKYVGLGFLLATLLSGLPQTSSHGAPLRTEYQQRIYHTIQQERFYIYMTSLLFSLLVVRTMKLDLWSRVTVLMTLTASLYMLVPKSAYMSDYLTSAEERAAYRRVYREQQWRYYGSIVAAILASSVLC